MKPDWKDAPEWAQWLAMDADGEWYWFESMPRRETDCWFSYGTRYQRAGSGLSWEKTMERRP